MSTKQFFQNVIQGLNAFAKPLEFYEAIGQARDGKLKELHATFHALGLHQRFDASP